MKIRAVRKRRSARDARRLALALAVAVAGSSGVVGLGLGSVQAYADMPAQPSGHTPGTTESLVFTSQFGTNPYRVYTPRGYRAGTALPVVVMIHGCNTTAAQQEAANEFDQLADQKNFIVAYPDHDGATSPAPMGVGSTHPVQCWRWFDPTSNVRGSGDPYQLAMITQQVTASWDADASRVYAVGMSSGAMMTSILGATYPDLFAAIGVVAGCPYGGTGCAAPVWHSVENTALEAKAAHDEQGVRARVVPVISMQGDKDGTVDPGESANVVSQWIQTASLADGTVPILAPSATREGQVPDGRAFEVQTFDDRAGCLLAERWTVFGMDHYWPGGSADAASAPYTDPTGPSGAEAAWAFFSHFTLAGPVSC